MYSVIFWLIAAVGFVVQILCCVYGRNRLVRLLPMLAVGAIMVGTVVFGKIFGGLGLFAAFGLVWNELKVLAVMALGYILYALVSFAKK